MNKLKKKRILVPSERLSVKEFKLVVNAAFSKWANVRSGVPQGTTFGPLNFLLYVNDLPDSLSPGTECGIFSDDTKKDETHYE